MNNSEELKARLQTGITELEADLVKLRAALAVLESTDGSRASARGSRRRRTRRAGTSVQPDPVPAGKLTELLKRADGISTSELATQTSGSANQVLALLKELEQAGQAHRTGTRRGTRWHSGGQPRRGTRARRKGTQRGEAARKAEEQLASALKPVVAS
jgi:hypothetical protein